MRRMNIDRANAPNVATIDRLAAAKDDLDRDRAHVVAAEKESTQLLASLQAESNRVQEELTAARARPKRARSRA